MQSTTIQGTTQPSLLDRSVGALVRVNWETVAWAALLVLAVVSRFYDLGARAMSHDESLHAVYSLELYRTGNYQHNPMMHGTFLFHANAFIYALFGVTDATTRLVPVLTGLGAVLMAWAFRRWIGRTGALMVGLLFVVSPSLLFHSRYIRNDIYIVFFAMLWVYGMFRYLEERRVRWLYLMVMGMVWGFVAKENQFMTGTIFGVFFAGMAIWQLVKNSIPLNRNLFADLAVIMFTLVLPFTAPLGYELGQRVFGWENVEWIGFNPTTAIVVRFGVLVTIVTVLAVALAYFWFAIYRADDEEEHVTFATWAGLMLTFWAIAIILFTTFFTNPVNGLATGIVGSLGYWLDQHDVQRGSQPGYYYGILMLLYEFLPFVLSVGGALALLGWLTNKDWQPVKPADLPADVLVQAAEEKGGVPFLTVQRILLLFFLWWTIGAWGAYSYAGEKMPWLMTHLVQPMGLLGGWWLGSLLQGIDWKAVRERQTYWLIGLVPLLIFGLGTLFVADPIGALRQPTGGRDIQTLGQTLRFVMGLLLTGGLLYLGWTWVARSGWRSAARLMMVGVTALLLLLTVRFSYMLTYVNYDMATEYLVYAHGGPDIKRAIAEIEEISQRTVGDREIRVAYSGDASWPISWYMKFFPNSLFFGTTPGQEAMSAPVLIVGSADYARVEPYLARDYIFRNYRMVWWPEESYKNLTFGQVGEALTDPARRSRLWQIWFYRNHPDRSITAWPHRHEFRLYIKRDLAQTIWNLNVTPTAAEGIAAIEYPEIDLSAVAIYGGVYGDQAVLQPRDVAVGPDGNRYLLDTGNNRVVVLDAAGNFVDAFGSTCFLNDASRQGCVDPGAGGELGDGQFREPWGIAVDAEGRVFVADTWNGRIQVFDNQGNFVRKWGLFNIIGDENRDPYALFGPRGLAIADNGDLLVADTGNKRIIRYTPTGDYVSQVGGGGLILGRFEEPVDVAVHPGTGDVYVADVWNQRIQVLSPDLQPVDEWLVPSWQSRDIFDKAYVAVDASGTVYASDPQFAQVFVYGPNGEILAGFGRYGTDVNRFAKPNGLAIDPATNQLLVADADNNRVLLFSLEE
jgi:uncharacterized protein (TIGR03663 family)